MPKLLTHGAQLRCSEGSAPSALAVAPHEGGGESGSADGQAIAVATDHRPNANILPFGLCKTLDNPQVAAATSAASGTLSPQPCTPATGQPWVGGPGWLTVGDAGAVTEGCTLQCQWGGVIEIVSSPTEVEAE